MKRVLECVPNFSEGINTDTINQICKSITSVTGVKLLHKDSGVGANRTVITFAGEPEMVVEAAYRAVRTAGELIDMRQQKGVHPRIGATDVLPLIPIGGITLEEASEMAKTLAKRIAEELEIPTYCYEASATEPKRKNLATIRKGEYESLSSKLLDPQWKPDYGDAKFTPKVALSGATVVGARDFLIAVNFNLNTKSVKLANEIASEVRESGRKIKSAELKEIDNCGKPINNVDAAEKIITIPGLLKGCKAIGWFIDEYNLAQVSMNITDIASTPLHVAYETVAQAAEKKGLQVTGTEIIGLVPLKVLTDAGRYFLAKENLSAESTNSNDSAETSDKALIEIANKTLGLSSLMPFNPNEKIIEYLLEN